MLFSFALREPVLQATRLIKRLVRWQPVVGVLLCVCLAGCGPSARGVYESKVFFEHCYRIDLDAQREVPYRSACWEQWLSTHAAPMQRDRMQYALRRIQALREDDPHQPTLESEEGHRRREQAYLTSPLPSSLFGSPPALAKPVDMSASAIPAGPLESGNKTGTCFDRCHGDWESCRRECKELSHNSCRPCDANYRNCRKDCLP